MDGNRKRRAVITGTGAVTSLGVGSGPLTDRWIAGESGIVDGLSRCSDYDAGEYMGRKEIRRTDRFTHLAAGAAQEALAEAGWDSESPYPPDRVACLVGSTVGGMETEAQQVQNLLERGRVGVSAMTVPMVMANSAAAYLALRHGWQGPSFAISSACASGGQTIGIALRLIQAGDADAVITGASEAVITPVGVASFRAMEAVSKSGRSLPFDARRDGFVLGEGAGVLVLEAEDLAAARGANVLGEVLGYASTGDSHHITAPDPEGGGATRAIELAMRDSGVTPDDIDYVNAHGTATELNDRVETLALKKALGPAAARIPVSSTKSVIGHLLAAAGTVEAVATVHALNRGIVAPTVGYEQPEEGLDLDYVPVSRPLPKGNGDRDGRPIALSNGFGFGGHNVVVCLAANPPTDPAA
jgi:3-oxoacyl-[acyl-carrier-protein] synthase II